MKKIPLEKSCSFFFIFVELLGVSSNELPLNYHPKFVPSVWINTKALKSVNRLLCLLRIKGWPATPERKKERKGKWRKPYSIGFFNSYCFLWNDNTKLTHYYPTIEDEWWIFTTSYNPFNVNISMQNFPARNQR